ncbi:hypothetical protein C2S52_016355 [Perilla frutescens var. hirtella]|nr:hypothetical protein C2S52_016355 [Perilla frutescens var. hirtella]
MPEYNPNVLKQLEAPMPWIGMYAAAASTVCTLAIAADALHGFRTRKYWFPSKYFSLNAASLTFLAVAMKLPVDLTTQIYTVTDRLAKVSSLVLMSTAMANFLTSLGSMDGKSVVMNLTALTVLVATVVGNVCIQIIQMRSYLNQRLVFWEEIIGMGSMVVLLVMFFSSGLMSPSAKRYLEMKYHQMHKPAVKEEQSVDMRIQLIKKYWVMAETSNPQFVIARSVMCTTSGLVSLMIALVLLEAEVRMGMRYRILDEASSNYKWSTRWILLSQTVGVIVGAIAPTSRWFVAMDYRSSSECKRLGNVFTVEGYWNRKLEEWQESSLSIQFRHLKSRKALHDVKGLILKLCISAQHLIVLASKLVLTISLCLTKPTNSCLNYVRRLGGKQVSDSEEVDTILKQYVMLLEGEVKLPAKTLRNIFKEVDEIIEEGKKRKPKNLLSLLSQPRNFNTHQIPALQQPHHDHDRDQDCWSLLVVTLASIALAIPNVEKERSHRLLTSVAEGLRYVKLVDNTLDEQGDSANARAAADAVWVKVELYHKWQDKDLHETSIKGKNAEEILQQLHEKSKRTVLELTGDAGDGLMQNWPAKAVAANSMHRVTGEILLNYCVGGKIEKTDEEVFELLSIMIADIVAKCLTNLPRAITIKCHRNSIEERERGVRKAAILHGETEEILALLQQRQQLPILAVDRDNITTADHATIEMED